MRFIEQIKGLVSRGEVQEASTNMLEDTINAILGDPISAGKLMLAIAKFPFFVREQLFWTKIEAFLNGVYLDSDDCAKLRAKLSELFLMTKMHYQMWLASWYVHNPIQPANRQQAQYQNNQPEQEYNITPMF